jgi:hypothetical protein
MTRGVLTAGRRDNGMKRNAEAGRFTLSSVVGSGVNRPLPLVSTDNQC